MAVVISFVGKFDGKDLERAQREMAKLGKAAEVQDSNVKSSFKSIAAGAVGLGAALGVGFAGLQAVGNAIRDAFTEAQESIKTTAATAQIISSTGGAAKVTADQVGELANRISELIGVDDELVQASANLVLTFKNIRNEGDGLNAVFDRTVMAAQDLAAAGFGDAESAAKMLGKALNDPERGLTALSRAGVTFTQQQKDQIAALTQSGNVLGAQKLILAEVESQVGGVAAATATSADKFKVLYRNTLEALGLALMPLANAFMSALIPALRTFSSLVTNASGFVRDNAEALKIAGVAVAALTASLLVQRGVLSANALAFAAQTVAVNAYAIGVVAARVATVALTAAMQALPWVAVATGIALLITKLDEGADAQAKYREETERTLRASGQLRDENGRFTKEAIALGVATRGARNAQRDHSDAISGTVSSAIALGNTLPKVTDKTYDAADAASTAAQSYVTMWEAIVQSQRQSRDMANTSGTVSSAIAEGVTKGADLTEARLREIRESLDGVSRSARSGAGAAKDQMAAVADLRREWRDTAASITADVDGLSVTLSTRGEEMSKALADKFSSRLDVFKAVVTEQQSIIRQAQDALDSYSKSVVDTILGGVRIQTEDAAGNALTPEQIVTSLFGGVENRRKAVEAVAAIATKIPEALANQLVSLTSTDPQGAIALANYLANNPAQVAKLNENYNALSEFTKTALGDPMGVAFAKVGDDSAAKLMADAKKRIADEAKEFKDWVASKLRSRVIVEVEYRAINSPPAGTVSASSAPAPAGRARGGSVSSATPYLVGEVGPELFIPGRGGTIIPNDQLPRGSGGNTYNITVQAGIGDPREVGRAAVEAIRAFERASGPVFQAA